MICSIPGCSDPVRVKMRGWCKRHYDRWRRHGDPEKVLVKQARKGEPWAFIEAAIAGSAPTEPNGCILWPFGKHPAGYARISKRVVTAIVLERVVGPKPSPKHTAGHAPHAVCGNTSCIAPAHLSWQTYSEQLENRMIDGTHYRLPPLRGLRHHSATVSDEQVREAVRRVRAGETQTAVAADLGVSQRTVSGWVRGEARSEAMS